MTLSRRFCAATLIPITTSSTTFAVLELLLLKASCLLVRAAKQIDLQLFSFISYRTKLKLDRHNRNKLKKITRRGWVEQYNSIVLLRMLYLVIVTSWNIAIPVSVVSFHVKVYNSSYLRSKLISATGTASILITTAILIDSPSVFKWVKSCCAMTFLSWQDTRPLRLQ